MMEQNKIDVTKIDEACQLLNQSGADFLLIADRGKDNLTSAGRAVETPMDKLLLAQMNTVVTHLKSNGAPAQFIARRLSTLLAIVLKCSFSDEEFAKIQVGEK